VKKKTNEGQEAAAAQREPMKSQKLVNGAGNSAVQTKKRHTGLKKKEKGGKRKTPRRAQDRIPLSTTGKKRVVKEKTNTSKKSNKMGRAAKIKRQKLRRTTT